MTPDNFMKDFTEVTELLAENHRLLDRSTLLIRENLALPFWRVLAFRRNNREIDRIHDRVSHNLAEVERLQNLGPEDES